MEDALEKEKKEKKKAEEMINQLKTENTKLKSIVRQAEAKQTKGNAETTMMLTDFALTKKRLEAVSLQLAELENNNALQTKIIKEKEAYIGEIYRSQEEMQKKNSIQNGKLREHDGIEKKLAQENENFIEKMKKLEIEHAKEVKELKDLNHSLMDKIANAEFKIQEANKNKENDEHKKQVEEFLEKIEGLQEEKEKLINELNNQRAMCFKYEGDVLEIGKEFEELKSEVNSQNEEIKKELLDEKNKVEDLLYEKKQAELKNQELQSEKESANAKSKQIEEELKEAISKLAQFKKLNEDLEERNHQLMNSLHQDVNERAKKIKGQTFAALVQSQSHQLLGNSKKTTVQAGTSPPQNLIVESGDDITIYESILKSAKISPNNLNKKRII